MALNIIDYVLIAIFFALVYYYVKGTMGFFKKKGIKTLTLYPLAGNMMDVLLRKSNLIELMDRTYKAFPDEKFVGFYQFLRPITIVRDIETIKQITVKDFDFFQDHSKLLDENIDPLFGKNLLSLSGQKWRDMRATLSPAFTSSKMKNMLDFVADCGKNMTNFYLEKAKDPNNSEAGFVEVEMKDAFSKYANDVIASSAFGVKVDSLRDDKNDFFSMGKEATTFKPMNIIKLIGITSMPKLMKILRVNLFDAKMQNFFRQLVIGQMKEREEKNIVRQDMIHLLMETKKGSLEREDAEDEGAGFAAARESGYGKNVVERQWSDDDLVAQALLFFFAGFETSSTLLCYLAHELTTNSDVRQKLQREIDAAVGANDGQIKYADIQNMKYLDMVVSETLRKWPPGLTDRVCAKPYAFSNSNGTKLQMNANDTLWIPIFSIHRDPKYYKDPEKFDPERFSDENKSSIQPFTYIPFGSGPRNCIGSRFALMEIKSAIFHLLSRFDFVPTAKTPNPIVFKKSTVDLSIEGGFWIGLKPRNMT